MTQDVPTGAWITTSPVESVVTFCVITPPETELCVTPSMMVSGRNDEVVGRVQTMWNVAPASGSPSSFVLSTEMLPPTMKHAGPALRLLACDSEGAAVVFA